MTLYFMFAGMRVNIVSVMRYAKHGAYVEWGTEDYAFVPYRDLYVEVM